MMPSEKPPAYRRGFQNKFSGSRASKIQTRAAGRGRVPKNRLDDQQRARRV